MEPFTRENERLLKVSLSDSTVMAKTGSMVAYQGDISFEHAPAKLGKIFKKAVTGTPQTPMAVTGTGEVFLADQAQNVHLLTLDREQLTVNPDHLLAFDSSIAWTTERLRTVAGVVAGGLFNIVLQGSGSVALVTHGEPLRLAVNGKPTVGDALAAVAWSDGVTAKVRPERKLKDLAKRAASHETVQLAFSGAGWVLVQPSEGPVPAPPPADEPPIPAD